MWSDHGLPRLSIPLSILHDREMDTRFLLALILLFAAPTLLAQIDTSAAAISGVATVSDGDTVKVQDVKFG